MGGTTILANNARTGVAAPNLETYSQGDGINVTRDNAFVFGESQTFQNSGGLIQTAYANIVPNMLSLSLTTNDKKELVAIYIKDPSSDPETSLVKAMMKVPDGTFEAIDSLEDIGFKGISKDPVRITEATTVAKEIIALFTGEKQDQVKALLVDNNNMIDAISTLINIDRIEGTKFFAASVDNIGKVAPAVQVIFDALPEDIKKDFFIVLKNAGLEKMYDRLEKGKFKDINSENMTFLDLSTLYKLDDAYLSQVLEPNDANLGRINVIQADILMAKRIKELNKDIIDSIEYTIENCVTVGSLKDGNTLVVKSEEIAPNEKLNGWVLSDSIKKGKTVDGVIKLLQTNQDELVRRVTVTATEKDPTTKLYQSLMTCISLSTVVEKLMSNFQLHVDMDAVQSLPEEERKKVFESAKVEMYSNKDKQKIFKELSTGVFASFVKVINASSNVPYNLKGQLERTVKAFDEAKDKELSPKSFEDSLDTLKRALKHTVLALKHKQNNVLIMTYNNNIAPTQDMSRFPKGTGRGNLINYKEYLDFDKNPQTKRAFLAFSAKIQEGPNHNPDNSENPVFDYKFGTYLTPVVYFTEDKSVILKPIRQINGVTRLAYTLQKAFDDCDYFANIEAQGTGNDVELKEGLKKLKDSLVSKLKGVNESSLKSKVFPADSFDALRANIIGSNTYTELINALNTNTLFASARKIPSVTFCVESSKASIENVKKLLAGSEITELSFSERDNMPSIQVKSSYILAEALKSMQPLSYFSTVKKEGDIDYAQSYAKKEYFKHLGKGQTYKTPEGKTVFTAIIGGQDNKDEGLNIFLESIERVAEIPADIERVIYDTFPSNYKQEKNHLQELGAYLQSMKHDTASEKIEALMGSGNNVQEAISSPQEAPITAQDNDNLASLEDVVTDPVKEFKTSVIKALYEDGAKPAGVQVDEVSTTHDAVVTTSATSLMDVVTLEQDGDVMPSDETQFFAGDELIFGDGDDLFGNDQELFEFNPLLNKAAAVRR